MIAAASVRHPVAAERLDVRAPAQTQWASVAAWALEALFATFSSRLGGDAEPLAEEATAGLVDGRAPATPARAARCTCSTSTGCFAPRGECCAPTLMPRT